MLCCIKSSDIGCSIQGAILRGLFTEYILKCVVHRVHFIVFTIQSALGSV